MWSFMAFVIINNPVYKNSIFKNNLHMAIDTTITRVNVFSMSYPMFFIECITLSRETFFISNISVCIKHFFSEIEFENKLEDQ